MPVRKIFWLILGLAGLAFVISLPGRFVLFNQEFFRPELNLKFGPFHFYRDLEIKRGLDLAGGSHLVFQAQMAAVAEADKKEALAAAAENIRRRVDLYGVAEAVVQTSQLGDSFRLVVELPGIEDINQAVSLIGQTAQLDFRELAPEATQAAALTDFLTTDLTGKDLVRSQVEFDPNTSQPLVGLSFSDTGTQKFAAITKRNLGKQVAIFLDQLLITAPLVQEEITTGKAVIAGDFTLAQAKMLSTQLNAGALPVPIEIIEQRHLGATLGEESVRRSLQAGLVGLLMVMAFMVANYGRLGILAAVGLVIYGLLSLALYKLIPVTLTLPGLAGFLLSVGMAVDANILIFEKAKEEERAGQPKLAALQTAFGRTQAAIKDANVVTLIICFLLFNPFDWSFLNTAGMIRGFALTLSLGVFLSLFTGVVVSRTFLLTFSGKAKT